MNFPFYVVKAFSSVPLRGNTVGVVMVGEELSPVTMQKIASTNNFAETVFLYREEGRLSYYIWWFTPDGEVFDVGRATLAAQYVLFEHVHKYDAVEDVTLNWIAGQRQVSRNDYLTLIYSNVLQLKPIDWAEDGLVDAGLPLFECEDNLIVKLKDCDEVMDFKPNLAALKKSCYKGLIVTAKDFEYDYCCRYFLAESEAGECAVSASIHSYLGVFWASLYGINDISGIQYSPSSGQVSCHFDDQAVRLSGDCCLYAKGEMAL